MPFKAKIVRTIGYTPRKSYRPQEGCYGTIHRKLRAELLNTFPFCQFQGEGCEGFSVEAHHLQYPATSLSDYMALCPVCHRHLERAK